jgi:hypothetical protein
VRCELWECVVSRGRLRQRDKKSKVRYKRGDKVCGKWEGLGAGAIYELTFTRSYQTDTFENGRGVNVIET